MLNMELFGGNFELLNIEENTWRINANWKDQKENIFCGFAEGKDYT